MKIICPTDLSPASENALEFASRLAKKQGAEILLLHSVPEATLITNEGSSPDLLLKAEAAVEKLLDKHCKNILHQYDVKAGFVIVNDTLINALNQYDIAGEKNMVIMGTEGANELNKYLFGSHTTEVIESVQMPILVIPAEYTDKEINHMVYATNYAPGDDESLTQLLTMADLLGADVTILHVSKKPDPNYQDIFQAYHDYVFSEFYYDFKLKIEQVNGTDIVEELIDYMDENDGDLLAMITHKRNFISELFHNSLTRKMALIAEYPLLVFHG